MHYATFLAIFFKNSSGHPGPGGPDYNAKNRQKCSPQQYHAEFNAQFLSEK
jgi:hypothetical protein